MKKILVVAPVLSSSGYGNQSRFAINCLKKHPELFDVYVQPTAWGLTGNNIEEGDEKNWLEYLIQKTMFARQSGTTFDISLQITVPDEWQKICPIDIGFTAGIETTKVSPRWLEKAALMSKIITISNHSKDVYNNTVHYVPDPQTGLTVELKNKTPIDIVHYEVKNHDDMDLGIDFETDFNFLSVAQWGPRKDIESTVTCFLEEFKNESNVGLVIKTNIHKNNIADKEACKKKLHHLKMSVPDAKCKVYLVHGNMTEKEMHNLYRHPKIKAFISTTRGEGFSYPMFESAYSGLPVIATDWSGHLDFLYVPEKDEKGKEKLRPYFSRIDYDLRRVDLEEGWYNIVERTSMWAYVKPNSVKLNMREVYKNYNFFFHRAKKLKDYVIKTFTKERQYEKFCECFYPFVKTQKTDKPVVKISEMVQY